MPNKTTRHGLALIVLSCSVVFHLAQAKKPDNTIEGRKQFHPSSCDEIADFQPLKAHIRSLQPDVKKIVDYVTSGPGAGTTYNELAELCDTFGPRMSGSKSLERAIDHMEAKMANDSKLIVTREAAMIPHWEVLSHSASIMAPVHHPMSILTLGGSVSTNGSLKAEVALVHDFNELDKRGQEGSLNGKIVVFNYKFTIYPESVKYRTTGALRAAKYGAAAALIRSVTSFSINSPHAGVGSKSIPTAAITVEDANLIERWIKRNKTVMIKLHIETKHNPDVQSYNLIGDIVGSNRPDEIVFVSGHLDSWYNTAGAMDDGGGMMISYKALDVLSKLGLRGNRTMRAILWTAEEPGLIGAQQYFNNHKHELDKFKAVIESDEGTFRPLGLAYKNVGPLGQCVLQETLFVTSNKVSDMELTDKYEGSDIELFSDAGVPGLSLFNDNRHYFDFHHTSGDTMDVEDPVALDRGTALFASTVYVLSRLDVDLRK